MTSFWRDIEFQPTGFLFGQSDMHDFTWFQLPVLVRYGQPNQNGHYPCTAHQTPCSHNLLCTSLPAFTCPVLFDARHCVICHCCYQSWKHTIDSVWPLDLVYMHTLALSMTTIQWKRFQQWFLQIFSSPDPSPLFHHLERSTGAVNGSDHITFFTFLYYKATLNQSNASIHFLSVSRIARR